MRKILTHFVDDWLEITVDILDRYLMWCDKSHDIDHPSGHKKVYASLRPNNMRSSERRRKMIAAV